MLGSLPASPSPSEPTDAQRLVRLLAAATYERVDKPWGTEHMLTLPNDGGILKVIHVKDGAATSLQHHDVKEETTFVLEKGYYGGVEYQHGTYTNRVPEGGMIHVKPGTVHRTYGPCLLLEATTPENDDVVRHSDNYGRTSS